MAIGAMTERYGSATYKFANSPDGTTNGNVGEKPRHTGCTYPVTTAIARGTVQATRNGGILQRVIGKFARTLEATIASATIPTIGWSNTRCRSTRAK